VPVPVLVPCRCSLLPLPLPLLLLLHHRMAASWSAPQAKWTDRDLVVDQARLKSVAAPSFRDSRQPITEYGKLLDQLDVLMRTPH
jgi:hypothetical protein